MFQIDFESKIEGRSKKPGLLTENERKILRNEVDSNYHQRWELRNTLSGRIQSCIEDIELIWDSVNRHPFMKDWAKDDRDKLYTLADSIHPRKYAKLEPYIRGKIHTRTEIRKKRSITLYWFNEDGVLTKHTSLPWPDYTMIGIKSKLDKNLLKFALILEDRIAGYILPKLKKIIIPRETPKALPINEIEKRVKIVKKIIS